MLEGLFDYSLWGLFLATYQATATVIPFNVLKLSLTAKYALNKDNVQYVGLVSIDNQDHYLLAHLDQKTLGATFRVDYNITPEISIQYYGSPFISTGEYTRFKIVNDPRANNYTDRFTTLPVTKSGEETQGGYYGGGYGGYGGYYDPGTNYQYNVTVQNPDFTFTQFRSNLVFRWEYRPGSQLFLVWANERTGYKNDNTAHVQDGISQLRDVFPNNIFLIKLNYWFSL